jgi:hypothetical protein
MMVMPQWVASRDAMLADEMDGEMVAHLVMMMVIASVC